MNTTPATATSTGAGSSAAPDTVDPEPARADGRRPPLPARLAWALGSGTVLQGLNSAIIAVALVPIAEDLGSPATIPWLVSALYIAAAVGSPTGGRLADLFGPRRIYLTGLAIVLVASVAGPFMPSVPWLVADRVLLGLGTSLQFPAAMLVIRQQAARRERDPVAAIGVIALCGQSTAALGPTVGGLVVVLVGWQGIFWVNVPVVINSALWLLLVVPRDDPGPSRGLRAGLRATDPLGLLGFVATLVTLMLALLSWDEGPRAWWCLAAAVPLGVVFCRRELRAEQPFLDLRLLRRHPQVAATCLRAVATFTSFYCVFYGLPQWFQADVGLDPATSGLLLAPVFVVGIASTLIATRLGRRVRPRALLVVGTSAMVLAGSVLAGFVDPGSPVLVLVLVSALLGVPNGFNNLGNQLLLHAGAPDAVAGGASGLYRTAQYLGAAVSAVVVAHALAGSGGITVLGTWIAVIGATLLVLDLIALRRHHGGTS